jgi:hypothetical protein
MGMDPLKSRLQDIIPTHIPFKFSKKSGGDTDGMPILPGMCKQWVNKLKNTQPPARVPQTLTHSEQAPYLIDIWL